MLPTTASAKTKPTRKAGPLLLARWLNSIKMTAMIGTGLMATPIAWGKIVPIAFPMTSFLRVVLEGDAAVREPQPSPLLWSFTAAPSPR